MDLAKFFDLQDPNVRASLLKYSFIIAYVMMVVGFILMFVFWDY